jgi:hypothetical protein
MVPEDTLSKKSSSICVTARVTVILYFFYLHLLSKLLALRQCMEVTLAAWSMTNLNILFSIDSCSLITDTFHPLIIYGQAVQTKTMGEMFMFGSLIELQVCVAVKEVKTDLKELLLGPQSHCMESQIHSAEQHLRALESVRDQKLGEIKQMQPLQT